MPSAADLDGQRTGGDGLRGVPGDIPEGEAVAAGEIHAGDLQVFPVNITLEELRW